MGIETLVAIAAVSTIAEGVAQSQAASATKEGLDLQNKEFQLQYLQKQNKTLSNMDTLLQHQTAQMTVRGTGFDSASFNAIQRDTINTGSKELANESAERQIQQSNIDAKKQATNATLFSQLFGEAAGLATSGATLFSGGIGVKK